MRLALLALPLVACHGHAAPPPVVDNGGGGEVTAHAPCYPDRAEVTARALFTDAAAGAPGTCQLVQGIDDRHGEGGGQEITRILDGEVVVGTMDQCSITVELPGITDDAGVQVGDTFKAVITAYPEPEFAYTVAGGLGGEAQLAIARGDAEIAWFTLDGMEGEDLEGQRVASFFVSSPCDF